MSKVVELSFSDFLNIRDIGVPIPGISEISQIQFRKNEPDKVYGKYSYGETEWTVLLELEQKRKALGTKKRIEAKKKKRKGGRKMEGKKNRDRMKPRNL